MPILTHSHGKGISALMPVASFITSSHPSLLHAAIAQHYFCVRASRNVSPGKG